MVARFVVVLLVGMLFAGCTAPPAEPASVAQEPQEATVDFSWSPEAPVAKEPVRFTPDATDRVAKWRWEFGDGTTSDERSPTHAFAEPRELQVVLTASFPDGRQAVERHDLQVRPAAQATASPTTAPTSAPAPEAEPVVELSGPQEASTNEEAELRVTVREAPRGTRLVVEAQCDEGCAQEIHSDAAQDGTRTLTWTPEHAGAQEVVARLMDSGRTVAEDLLAVEVEAMARDWPEPTAQHVRPGDYHSPAGCTLNFLYTYQHERYFFGSAAHCLAGGPDDDGQLWDCGSGDYSAPVGSTTRANGLTLTMVYSSWNTMHLNGESNSNICRGNDFLLLEVAPGDLDRVHPAVRMYGGPTGLGSISDLSLGDDLRSYGRSPFHDDSAVTGAENSVLNPKVGHFIGSSYGGWSYHVYMLPQGVFGDSGSGLMDVDGRALGAASTISALGGSNNYANIEKALAYMEQKEGWAPTLVTWDDWDPEPRLP